MKSLAVFYDNDELKTELQDIPVPNYAGNEILIKVVVAGTNPKDWKQPKAFNSKINQGDDVGGIVEAVGSNVRNFRKGDRVAGFHEMKTERGTYAEYTVCPEHTVWHIPDSMSFEEAATMPLAAFTAAVGLYRNLGLPMPFGRSDADAGQVKVPLVINGASGAVGAFAVQLAKLNPNISPIIGIAGSSADFAKAAGCDAIVDYRSKTVAEDLSKALNGQKCRLVLDTTNSKSSVEYLSSIIEHSSGRYTSTGMLGSEKELLDKAGVWHENIWVGSIHENKLPGGHMFGAVMSRIFEWASAEGNLKGQPYTVVEHGLVGVFGALTELRDRKGGNKKFVCRIADTPGL